MTELRQDAGNGKDITTIDVSLITFFFNLSFAFAQEIQSETFYIQHTSHSLLAFLFSHTYTRGNGK